MRIGFLSHSDMSIYYFRLPIMRALKDAGHKVYAIMPKGAYEKRVGAEFECVFYDIDGASINPLRVGKNALNLAKALAPLHLDMLQSAAHKSNVFGTMAASMIGIKNIFCLVEGLGSAYTGDSWKHKILRFVLENLYKNTLNKAKACIFVSEADAKFFSEKKLCDKDKIKVIKSVGINCSLFAPSPELAAPELEPLKGKKIVLMAARALVDKGVGEFYEAADILSARKDCAFVFVGSPVKGKAGFSTEFLGSSANVFYLPWSDNIKALLNASYIYALPSYAEGFPRTILEAMAMAKPCVASKARGCNEAVCDGQTGLLCEVRSGASLAAKISVLLDDESLALNMGQKARQIAQSKYDESIVVKEYLELYKSFGIC